MADLTPPVPQGRQIIEGYGPSHFRVNGEIREGAILVLPTETHRWSVARFEDVTAESLQPIVAVAAEVDLLLLGTGKQLRPPPAGLRAALKVVGVALEPMDSGAACRTYNVLMAEGRRVAAALLPAG